ncbi:N-acetyltransferase B complex non catalytic subunit [Apiospora marii]|uniref:N-acetyltransferase B complex non catalytic subunit n=1 Tax=Apiospora marii TaxID=335849 RepID=A0ABR1S8G9_9PEZI
MNGYRAHRPSLRNDCGMQIQRAWQDGAWANVINMARSKAKLSKDPYFETLELAARSQLETPIDRQAVWQAVDKILNDKTVVKDAATADLYEWALVTAGMTTEQYPKYVGAMRVNVVKANMKQEDIAKTSFISCVANSDWEHTQQIAAIMDKSFPSERSYHFRNIITTYIYASSLEDTDVKKSMFRTLALRQIEKAKSSRQDSGSESLPPRAIATQDDMLLWLNMTIKENEGQNLVKCLTDPKYNALHSLRDGFETICSTMMDYLMDLGAWDEFYTICKAIFDNGVAFWRVEEHKAKEKAEVEAQPKQEKSLEQKAAEFTAAMDRLNITTPEDLKKARLAGESIATRTVVKDSKMWENFIIAASKQPNAKEALKEVEEYFTTIIKFGSQHTIYHTQLDKAKLTILFETPVESESDEASASEARINGLVAYFRSHYGDMSCFDTLSRFYGLLSISEAKALLERLDTNGSQSEESQFQKIMLLTLRLRLRYYFTTAPNCYKPSSTYRGATCGICDSDSVPERCESCLKDIAKECVWAWKAGLKQGDLQEKLKSEGVSPYTDLTIIGSVCLLKLAGVDGLWGRNDNSPLAWADRKRVMQAILWMDAQYYSQSTKSQHLSILLVKLYILIGAVSHAKSIWDSLEVKNVTLNSLGPLFADRLGTMAPGLWQDDAQGDTPTPEYLQYYISAIDKNIPNNIRLSFDHGNYASVLGHLVTRTKHKQSCTMVMALVDHFRGIRSVKGEVKHETWQERLVQHIKPGMHLHDTTDYGPFPNIEGNPDRPIHDFLSIGPGLSEERAHLSLLSERFLSLIAYKEPKEYKPANAALAKERDRNVVITACQDTAEWMSTLLNRDDIRDKLTLPEVEYYSLVQALASYIGLSLEAPQGDGRDNLVELIRSQLVNQVSRLMDRRKAVSEADATRADVFYDISALHANGMLRESALATVYMMRYLERTRGSDAKSPVPKWMTEHLKILRTATSTANRRLKEYIERLMTTVNPAGWADRIAEWAFGDLAKGTRAVSDDANETFENSDTDMLLYKAIGPKRNFTMAVDVIVDSWADAARGWSKVKIIE